jgi:hypothetical protein
MHPLLLIRLSCLIDAHAAHNGQFDFWRLLVLPARTAAAAASLDDDQKRVRLLPRLYRPTVTPGVERKTSAGVVAFLSSMTCLVMTVVWLGILMIGCRDEDRRLAL